MLVLFVVVALAGGVVLACVAGARRGASALERFLDFHRPAHAFVGIDPEGPLSPDDVEALPQVESSARGAYVLLTVEGPNGGEQRVGSVNPFATIEASGERHAIPYVVDGRLPDPGDPERVAIDEEASRRLGARPGDRLTLRAYLPEQMESLYAGGVPPAPAGPADEVTVGAVVRAPYDLNPIAPPEVDVLELGQAELYLGPGWWRAHSDGIAHFGGADEGTEVRLRGSEPDFESFSEAVRSLPGGEGAFVEFHSDAVSASDDARQAVRFEALALALAGLLLGLAAVVVVGQAISRQIRSDLSERPVLVAVGFTRRQMARIAALRILPVAFAGAAVAMVFAWALSPLTPIGLGRIAEVEPGLWFDPVVLVPGALVVLVAAVSWASFNGWRSLPPDPVASRRGFAWIAGKVAAAGARPAAVVGMAQLAPASRRRGSPVRPALVAGGLAVGALVGASVFEATLARVSGTPSEYGWSWDVLAGDGDDPALAEEGLRKLRSNENVASFAAWSQGEGDPVRLGGRELPVVGLDQVEGSTYVGLLAGRPAIAPGEIVLATDTRAHVGADLGSTVEVGNAEGTARYRVVGEALLTQWLTDDLSLKSGAVMTREGLERVYSDVALNSFLVDFKPGVDRTVAIDSLRDDFGPTVIPPLRPLPLENYIRVRYAPGFLAALVALLAIGSLLHLLLVTARRGRRDLAVLAVLGAPARVRMNVIATAATAVAVGALTVGIPVGLIAGRWGWRTVAESMGTPAEPIVPLMPIVGVVAAGLVIANAAGFAVGRGVVRMRPAAALRTE